MIDEDAFLRAIYENPDDDAPRLVFADWLDEHGDNDRAELIRLQVAWELAVERCESIDRELQHRAYTLRKAQEAQLLAGLEQPCDKRLTLLFERGFPATLYYRENREDREDREGQISDYRLRPAIPSLRHLDLYKCPLNLAVIEQIVRLPYLDSLDIYVDVFPEQWLNLLALLPPWTSIQVQSEAPEWPRVWRLFQQQRIAGLARTTPKRMRQTIRQQLNICTEFKGRLLPSRAQPITNGGRLQRAAEDFDLALLTSIPELEEIKLGLQNETDTGLQYLAQLTKLRSLELRLDTSDTITPLADCARLERLHVESVNGLLTDDGTEGLERLTGLRELRLRSTSLPRTATFERLAALTELRILDINFGELQGDSLQHLAGLRRLERLTLEGPTTDQDLRHLVGLTNLTFLALHDSSITDATLARLANLRSLRTLDLRRGHGVVTAENARQLANQLPHATIVHESGIYKSPKRSITFRRRQVDKHGSVLLPVDWFDEPDREGECGLHLVEEGWEHVDTRNDDREAQIGVRAWGYSRSRTPAEVSASFEQNLHRDNANIIEREVVKLTVPFVISYVCGGERQSLQCEVHVPDCEITLGCHTTPARFESFRRLFCFIAESLRVGDDAKRDVGEIVTVPVEHL